ncbi:MAG: serine dehydratase subunit alpha family protein [Desulfovibrio sp.]
MTYTVKDILQMEVAPALGCTEPVAIALGAAAAKALLPDDSEIKSIFIRLDPNVYKNGLAVAIPGTDGLTGLNLSSALGAYGGDASLGLEVLSPLDDDALNKAKALVEENKVTAELRPDTKGLYIHTTITTDTHTAESLIEGLHDNIAALVLDGAPVEECELLSGDCAEGSSKKDELESLEAWLRKLSLLDLIALVDDLDEEDFAFLQEGVDVNLRLAEFGLKFGSGLGIGRGLERLARQKLISRDMIFNARMLTSAAADARMAGAKLPAMSSAGSGNHGLTAVLPIWAIREFIDCDDKNVLEAIALSHLVTGYVKAFTGRLSAVCGCSVAAGAGATAGITYLLGGTHHHIAGAIKNLTEDLAGVICDGAKAGCALKLSTAAGTAVQAALFSLQGVNVQPTDGIIGSSPEQTMQNIGTLSTQGMVETDRTILRIMLEKGIKA